MSSSNVFQAKMRKREEEKGKMELEVEEGKQTEETRRREMRSWDSAHTAKVHRHRRTTVLVAAVVRGRPRISRKQGGKYFSA